MGYHSFMQSQLTQSSQVNTYSIVYTCDIENEQEKHVYSASFIWSFMQNGWVSRWLCRGTYSCRACPFLPPTPLWLSSPVTPPMATASIFGIPQRKSGWWNETKHAPPEALPSPMHAEWLRQVWHRRGGACTFSQWKSHRAWRRRWAHDRNRLQCRGPTTTCPLHSHSCKTLVDHQTWKWWCHSRHESALSLGSERSQIWELRKSTSTNGVSSGREASQIADVQQAK